jgi:hypothetical protein
LPDRHDHDNLPELYVPELELDEYEKCRTIPKHTISCAKDVVQLAEIDKSGFFMIAFLLSNFYVLMEHIKYQKTQKFVEKFNAKLREIFQAKYSARSDFSQHKFIEHKKILLFKGLQVGENLQKFWKKILKKFSNNVVEMSPEDERIALLLKNALDEMHDQRGLGDNSLKMVAARLNVGYNRAYRLIRV